MLHTVLYYLRASYSFNCLFIDEFKMFANDISALILIHQLLTYSCNTTN